MANITVKELSEFFLRLSKEKTRVDFGAKIQGAAVVGENDPEYPPGTILFDCKSLDKDDPDHILCVYPMKLGRLQ